MTPNLFSISTLDQPKPFKGSAVLKKMYLNIIVFDLTQSTMLHLKSSPLLFRPFFQVFFGRFSSCCVTELYPWPSAFILPRYLWVISSEIQIQLSSLCWWFTDLLLSPELSPSIQTQIIAFSFLWMMTSRKLKLSKAGTWLFLFPKSPLIFFVHIYG